MKNKIIIQIPNRMLYTQTSYSKIFLVTLFIATGTTFFSCQNKEAKKQEIENIQVAIDSAKKEQIAVDKTPLDKNSKIQTADSPTQPSKTDQAQLEKKATNDVPKSEKTENKKNNVPKKDINSNPVTASETNAEFAGGIDQFLTFFQKEFKKPEESGFYKLKINLSFAVEKNGSVSYLQSEPAINKNVEQEIIRVLNACPKWQPGESNGKKVKRQYSLPITLE
ncbi:hypothetical protein [Flavobacterium sp. KACC 22761]|uniref:hypothetical protein n=1 Tax=Flavobacterium sp. KACC 22761 TaxID=3092665 RepID=UPI002A761791|nr:hypothetical protein [Flavobacterium sp. KACC 22761]WPO80598.1 hypothetical protein SCB73_09455 [Flavobacterium sp. KACC 22761]